ncbi:MAG TPA: class I tRNA ligase family protein [Solirubrobacteraceae bacterium]|nr:class I tRNA ligase family protein [Solirubrobacteraceae bacterium]
MGFYLTTPIYYVNAAPHLGHAYTTIGADILARHHRQRGEDVFLLTGTDEHGEPVALAAEREGVSPQELADRNAARFQSLMPLLGISNDFFIRTSDAEHQRRVQEVLSRVRDNGYVYEGLYEGWYCPRCADFKTDNEAGEDNTCPVHRIPLTREREENYFFALSRFQEPLERLYRERPDWVLPEHRFNEARSFIGSGLQDVSLTRQKIRWGVPVPWDSRHVFYVWFDALLNYVTALSYAREGEDLDGRFWPPSLQVIGKDILKFHAVFWPALLMAAELELPRHLFVHGFLLSPPPGGGDGEAAPGSGAADGALEKMSKSRGNVIDPFAVVETFGADALRYYLFREVTFGQDGPVSEAGFAARYESELANEYGNLASRSMAMVRRYRAGTVPAVALDGELAAELAGLADEVSGLLDRAAISAALEAIWVHVRRLNRYVEEQAPWQLAKDPDRAADLDRVLASLIEGLRVISVLLAPFLPHSVPRLLAALGQPDDRLSAARPAAQGSGGELGELPPLFPKV